MIRAVPAVSVTPGGGTGIQMPSVTGGSRVLKLSPKKLCETASDMWCGYWFT